MIKYFLQYALLGPLLALIRILPVSWAHFMARRLAGLTYFISSSRRHTGMENLERSYGSRLTRTEKKRILRLSFRHMAMSIADLFIVKKIRPRAKELFRIHDLENYEKALAKKKGVVLVTSHVGSWEFLAFLFYLTNTRCTVIVKDIRNPFFNRQVAEARRETGLNPISKINPLKTVLKELKANNTVAILIDQWAGNEGIWQEFFGKETSTTTLPARLARKTGCVLLQAFCIRTPEGSYDILLKPPVDIDEIEDKSEASITRKLNQVLEETIRAYPSQWSWAHRRWKAKPEVLKKKN